jgi:alpha-N-arabinofuranosidase
MAGVNPYASQTTPTLTTVDNSSPSYSTERPLHPKSLDSTPLLINPSALIHPHHTVSDKLYSGFVEHLGRGIYGGIVDNPKAPSPKELLVKQDGEGILEGRLGWRKDVMDVIGKKGELEMPMLRWPGGQCSSPFPPSELDSFARWKIREGPKRSSSTCG